MISTPSYCVTVSLLACLISGEHGYVEAGFATQPTRRWGRFRQRTRFRLPSTTLSSSAQDNDSLDWPVSQEDRTKSGLEEDDLGNIQIPSTGISVSDEMDAAQKDRFVTEVVPIKDLQGVAQLVTTPLLRGSFEPVRYLVALTAPQPAKSKEIEHDTQKAGETKNDGTTFVMVDIPPFAPQLVTRMKAFMGENSTLAAMLITSRDSIHYDDAPSVFSTRRADLDLWKQAFPNQEIVAYRLDIPRDCRAAVTQCLDGYGPFAMEESSAGKVSFVETGRPLTYLAWDHDVAEEVLSGQTPPDDNITDTDVTDDSKYSPEAIRAREENKRVLAVYTPGHSFGSLSFIFPETKVCCSGFTIPVEDNRAEENLGMEGTGPALDCRGYITTSRAGIARQMESARDVVNTYFDRFEVVLPSRGDPLFLDVDAYERKKALTEIIDQYDRIGQIYEQLGITSDDDDF